MSDSTKTLHASSPHESAVFKKNLQTFMHLYDPSVRVFDACCVWLYDGSDAGQLAVEGWFTSLGTERVKITFEDVKAWVSKETTSVCAVVTYAGQSATGLQLRSMQNRVTWVPRISGHVARIVHEHNSAPIGFEDSKAILVGKGIAVQPREPPNPSLKRSASGRPPSPRGAVFILHRAGLASCRCLPLSSNVRRRKAQNCAMPKTVTLFRLFVASPGDCRKERQLIREMVADWNAVYGVARALFIEPVLWETHARPALGDRPQALINRQLVESCDAMIGIFRERLGSPSGIAASGTIEEIDLFSASGKPVLLYFYRPQSPAALKTASTSVEDYKQWIGQNGLVWSYRGLWEFTRDVAKHIAMTMAGLAGTPPEQASITVEQKTVSEAVPRQPQAPKVPADQGHVAIPEEHSRLMKLRSETYFLWRELENLQSDQRSFSCEIRQFTFEKIRSSLDELSADNLLNYATKFAYSASFDEMPVLTVEVLDISEQLRLQVSEVVRIHGLREESGA